MQDDKSAMYSSVYDVTILVRKMLPEDEIARVLNAADFDLLYELLSRFHHLRVPEQVNSISTRDPRDDLGAPVPHAASTLTRTGTAAGRAVTLPGPPRVTAPVPTAPRRTTC